MELDYFITDSVSGLFFMLHKPSYAPILIAASINNPACSYKANKAFINLIIYGI